MTKTGILYVGFLIASSALFALGCEDEMTNGSGGSGGSGGEAGSSSSSSSSSSSGMMTAAEKYCASITTNCKDVTTTQYANDGSCIAIANALPAGVDTDTMGNTLGCRTYHAGAAGTDAATHCQHAGPSGGGACGKICEAFCDVATVTCKTEWPDKTACITSCEGWTPAGMAYNTSFSAGNTTECRLYHLSVAATDAASATTHCPHTVTSSTTCM
jgi:hypothetical protein